MLTQAFASGECFLIDFYDVYDGLRHDVSEELGSGAFPSLYEPLVYDALIYIFSGDQSQGERAIESKLIQMFIGPIEAIIIVRRLFKSIYVSLGIQNQLELMENYEYTLDTQMKALFVKRSKPRRFKSFSSKETEIAELEELIDNGGFVSERLRRMVHEHRI